MTRLTRLLTVLFFLSFVTDFARAETTPAAPAAPNNAKTFENLELLGTVMEKVLQDYVEPVDEEKLIEAAINGMLQSLDPHSYFLNAKKYEEMRVDTSGQFGGLGIQVTSENGLVRVISPIDDTPAYRAGIKSGDFITHIDRKSVVDMTLDDAVNMMRGEVNTVVLLTIARTGGESFDVSLTRAIITVKSVRANPMGDVGYVRISKFSEQTTTELEDAMRKPETAAGGKVSGWVVDLRNNPGGLLSQAVGVSDSFLDQGEIVSTRPRDKNAIERFNARPGDLAKGKPVVVLINEGSASASEVVAGALQDHRLAVIMGTRSYGKGSVQTVLPLKGQAALRMTTSRYYTPSGRSIQAKGIEPDLVVEQAKIQPVVQNGHILKEADRANALKNENALEAPMDPGKEVPKSTPKEAPKEAPAASVDPTEPNPTEDYQLSRAADLVRALSIYGHAAVK
ncbi:MAG: peptidase S41 [Alphaproteobacteria bacterium RIFOXYD12_FULL_60_8]|nr:MAG: peptidase S41 [Alphaproteobacteria bacterium RIFOXYD12_FULL_60_8]